MLDGKTKTYYKVEIIPGWKSQRLNMYVIKLSILHCLIIAFQKYRNMLQNTTQ
jgi:hypothetical protein